MERHRESGPGNSREHVAWAVDTLIAASRSFDSGQVQQEAIHPRDRRALYARLLVSHFSADRKIVTRMLRGLRRHRRPLLDLLVEKGCWAGRKGSAVALEDAIILDYEGLSNPTAFQQLWDDVRRYGKRINGLAEALALAENITYGAGLRAPWAAPMVLAAWLRHLVRRHILPRGLRRHSFSAWPSGPRTIYRSPPPIEIEYHWDPECETRDAARAQIMQHVDTRLDEVLRSYEAEGYQRVNLRKVGRDVEATYLRISDPERWSWRALSACSPPLSTSGVRRAVGRVLKLLEIEPPKKRAGRPPERRRLPHN